MENDYKILYKRFFTSLKFLYSSEEAISMQYALNSSLTNPGLAIIISFSFPEMLD